MGENDALYAHAGAPEGHAAILRDAPRLPPATMRPRYTIHATGWAKVRRLGMLLWRAARRRC